MQWSYYLINLSKLSQERNARLPSYQDAINYLELRLNELKKFETTLSSADISDTLYTTIEYYNLERNAFSTAIEMSKKHYKIADIKDINFFIRLYEKNNGFFILL